MRLRRLWEKYEDHTAVLLTVLCSAILIGLLFDFYYDLNDDVMMKDVLSGVYAGTPDGRNMQMLYILGSCISLCYKLWQKIPWYGLFLCLCQFASLYLTGVRLLRLCAGRTGKRLGKALGLALLTLFIWGVMLLHLTAVQYSVVCGLMASTAIFWFMTTPDGLSAKDFVKQNIPAVVLVLLAFWLRTEMLLLLTPFIAAAGLFRLLAEKNPLGKENWIKYGAVLGAVLAGMGCGLLIDQAAYGSAEWRSFRGFFNDRTRLYDFHMDVVTDDAYADSLAGMGISETQRQLLANYNFGLDEAIDGYMMKALADRAEELAAQDTDGQALLWDKAKQYGYRIVHLGDGSYSVLALAGYGAVFVIGILTAVCRKGKGRFGCLAGLGLLALIRSVPWMYILLKGRDPERIIHPLYLAEFAVLAGMAAWYAGKLSGGRTAFFPAGIGALLLLCMIPGSLEKTGQDMRHRQQANQAAQEIDAYCAAHPDDFYFEDVYSTVSFSQKMFEDVDNSIANRDIMGGWMCKSPLYRQKLAYFGMDSMADGLLGEHTYVIIKDSSRENGTDWLENYYREHGTEAELCQIDRIGADYGVYQVQEKE